MATLRQKIGQMLCVGFRGNHLDEASELKKWLMSPDGIGCLIHFDYDFEKQCYGKNILSLDQLQRFNQDIKNFYCKYHSEEMPLWLSIDLEGGRVDRLAKAKGYQPIPNAEDVAMLSFEERHDVWNKTASLLQTLSFDINFSPVVDLNLSPERGIFGPLKRCFSSDSQIVTQLTNEYLQVLQQHQIHGCLKHFPGHGSAEGDSHENFVDVSQTFIFDELTPYRKLIEMKSPVSLIMTAHVINHQLDKSGVPATLSKQILTSLLREEFKYQGLIISDDLQMHAISKFYSREDALVQTIHAGADMIIFGNQLGWDEPKSIIDTIEKLVQTEKIARSFIDNAYQRIEKFKKNII